MFKFIKKPKKVKVVIYNFSAELPGQTTIELTTEQWMSLWVALEQPFKKALNADDIMNKYNIQMYSGE